MRIWSLSWEDPLEEGMATHASILAWRIPCRGAWWATVHRVVRSRIRLRDLACTHSPPPDPPQKKKNKNMHLLVSVFFLRIWDELPYLGVGGLTLPVITLFLKVWPLNQQHQHPWRERNAESQTSLQTFWFRICILIRFPGDSHAHYDLRSTAEYPREMSKWKPRSILFVQKRNWGRREALHKSHL